MKKFYFKNFTGATKQGLIYGCNLCVAPRMQKLETKISILMRNGQENI